MDFLRFSVSAVMVLHAAILFTKFLCLYSGWTFLGMVNCQDDSSYLEDMDAVDYSAPSALKNGSSSMQDQDINECCKECKDDKGVCVPNCDACDVVEGATFLNVLKPSLRDETFWGINGFWSNYKNDSPIPIHNSNRHANASDSKYPASVLQKFGDYQKPSTRRPRRCCADCLDGDIYCLSSCEIYGCKPTTVCANAGAGAYGSFCQRECVDDHIMGFSAMTMEFLPDPACRANCAKYVQQMCAMNSCKDYGCEVYDCARRAVDICG